MSSKLKIYIDYPFEIWIDSVFQLHGETGKVNLIVLNRGAYQLELKENGRSLFKKVIRIEEDDFNYLEDLKVISHDSRFKLHGEIYYSLGSYSFAQGAELGLWSEEGFAITKPKYYKLRHLGYGLSRDMYDEAFAVDDIYTFETFSKKLGILSPSGEELLKPDYSAFNRIYCNLTNVRLFIELLLYRKYQRIGDNLTKYFEYFPNTKTQITDVHSIINLLPVFWFTVAVKYNKIGVVGFLDEIFVPFEFDDCEFVGPNDIFCNTYEQVSYSSEDQQITRANAYELFFKVKKNDKWGMYMWSPNGESRLIVEPKYDDCDFSPRGPMVTLDGKCATVDLYGNFTSEFIEKSKGWIFYY